MMRKKVLVGLLGVVVVAAVFCMTFTTQAGSLYTYLWNTTVKLKHTSLSYVFRVVNASDTALFTVDSSGNVTIAGDITGDGGDQLYGYLRQTEALSDDDTLTLSESGKVCTNISVYIAGRVYTLSIPLASSAAIGTEYTFIVATLETGKITIEPDGTDMILQETDNPGDQIWSQGISESITLVCVGVGEWMVKSVIGNWVDGN